MLIKREKRFLPRCNCYYMSMANELYTIGYASFSISDFMETLRKYSITCVVDVRSAPYSKFKPDFRKENLSQSLNDNGITYLFLGNSVGARVEDASCYREGKLHYRLLKKSETFKAGIDRILHDIKSFRLALMCAEKDPVNCHRTFLVCRTLHAHRLRILHILGDGSLEEHAITEKRLLKEHTLCQPDMFRSEADRIEEAYDRLCQGITLKH